MLVVDRKSGGDGDSDSDGGEGRCRIRADTENVPRLRAMHFLSERIARRDRRARW